MELLIFRLFFCDINVSIVALRCKANQTTQNSDGNIAQQLRENVQIQKTSPQRQGQTTNDNRKPLTFHRNVMLVPKERSSIYWIPASSDHFRCIGRNNASSGCLKQQTVQQCRLIKTKCVVRCHSETALPSVSVAAL